MSFIKKKSRKKKGKKNMEKNHFEKNGNNIYRKKF